MGGLLRVRINGVEKEYEQGVTYQDLADEVQKEYKEGTILLAKDGENLQELISRVRDGAEISFLTLKDGAGQLVYKRSITLLLLKAVCDLYGQNIMAGVRVLYSIGKGWYCTVRDRKADAAFIEAVTKRMKELTAQELPILKRTVKTRDAVRMFEEQGMPEKGKLFRYRRSSTVSLYGIEGFEDYFYGYMVPNTRYLTAFELQPYEEGFVVLIPDKANIREIPQFKPLPKLFQVQKVSTDWGNMLEIDTVGALNYQVSQGNMQEIILVQEALQEKRIAEIAEMIKNQPEKKLIMIAGPSSSGKTTFSHRLSVQLRAHGLRPHPIPVDDYFIDREQTPVDEYGMKDYECLEAIDVRQFNEDMGRLLAGERVELPTYNFFTGCREYGKGKYKQLGKEDILVIEGIHCLNDQLSYSLPQENKFKIYISALTQLNIDEHNRIPTTDGRLIRRIVRDARTRGTAARDTIARWYSVRRGEENHIFPYQEEANIMFNSALIYELAVLKQYAEPLLFGIPEDTAEYQEAKRLLKFLEYFVPVESDSIPNNSILREFVGGSCFHL
ncbi:MAG: nucleoside kinase [Lachnospiraceae bacterium]|nr:nucleoside kinase [Lachnospiraceae bacterium]